MIDVFATLKAKCFQVKNILLLKYNKGVNCLSMKHNYKINIEDLNLDNIKVGDTFIGQTALCKALGIEPKKSGNSKKAQEEQLKQYIRFEKVSQKKIVILEIYSTPKIKKDDRTNGNNSIYREDFLVILAKMLLKMDSSNEEILFSRGKLAEKLCLVNSNYRKGRINVELLSKKFKIPVENILDFYMINNTKIAKNIDSALLYYENSNYFSILREIAVCTKHNKHRMATQEERDLIELCKRKILEEMKFKSIEQVYYKNMWYIFNDKVIKEVQKYNDNIKYYYRAYKFFYINRVELQKVYDDMKSRKTTVTNTRHTVNENFKDSTIKSAKNRQNNANKKLSEGPNPKYRLEKYLLLTCSDFEKHNAKLVRNLISYKAGKIKEIKDSEILEYMEDVDENVIKLDSHKDEDMDIYIDEHIHSYDIDSGEIDYSDEYEEYFNSYYIGYVENDR